MEDDEYIPVEEKYYNYKAKDDFLLYLSDEISSFNKVHVCPYKVNNKYKFPFLNFLLHKKKGETTLEFLEIPIFKSFDSRELINYSKICLFGLCMLNDLNNFIENCCFNGFYLFENNLYLFFDINNCDININDIYSNNTLWFAIIDEIVNHQNICNIKINDNVKNLFISNDNLCFLINENNESYEIPVIGFSGSTKSKAHFKYIFGESIQNKNALLGPYYYFTDFKNTFKDDKNECIIRFALFTGNVKYIENINNDPIDNSDIKKQRLQDYNLDQNIERLTMRISDHDGLWSKTFDSAYLGYTELDNGDYLKNTPIIVIKEYEQQIPLSYHYINKNTRNQEIEKYEIL
jgi:hypothetical protein